MLKYSTWIFSALTLLLVAYNQWPEKPLPTDKPINKMVIEKSKRQMHVYSNGELTKTYKIALGFNPLGDKVYEGDGKTPEGSYVINDKDPNSTFNLNLGISYPDAEDIAKAKKLGKSPGGNIKIHGLRNGFGFIGKLHRFSDWTLGCIAVTNKEIKELYDHVAVGTKVEIRK